MKIKIKLRRTSAEIVASVDDLLTEILLRLPVKSLIRFKLVSKHWHSLITNPSFRLLRDPSSNSAVGLFLHHPNFWVRSSPRFEYVSFSVNKYSTNPPFPKLNFTEDPAGIGILHSCNGLLLCCSFLSQFINRRYYIYNPTTKRFLELPKLEEEEEERVRRSTNIQGLNLAFDPAKSPHYKVVCVRFSGAYQFQFEIYSSKTGSWRKCGEHFTARSIDFEKGLYWNGAIHWISYMPGGSLYFNLDDDEEKPKILPMPPITNGGDWRCLYYFGESCDHLHYIDFFVAQIQFNVYEMKRDYSEWFVKYRVDLSPVVASYPVINPDDDYDSMTWYTYACSVFTLVRGEKEEDSFLVLQIPGKVIQYNLVNGTFETIHEFAGAKLDAVESPLTYSGINGFQFIESLSCVDPDPVLCFSTNCCGVKRFTQKNQLA